MSSTWWQTRTPPDRTMRKTMRKTSELVEGIFKKYEYLLSDIQYQRSINRTGVINVFGTLLKTPSKRNIIYILYYIKALINKTSGIDYQLNFRHIWNKQKDGQILSRYIGHSTLPMLSMVKKTFRMVRR